MTEEWRTVAMCTAYEVSNLGRVRRVRLGRRGSAARELKPWKKKHGHLSVTLQDGPFKTKQLVHRLVALAFLPLVEGKPNVLHRDGNPGNNSLTNLYWGDQSENGHDMVRHGRCFPKEHPELMPRGDRHIWRRHPERTLHGEKSPMARLKERDVVAIREAVKNGASLTALAKEYSVTVQNIWRIKERRCWRHVA